MEINEIPALWTEYWRRASQTWWIKTLQFLLTKTLPDYRSENQRNILLYSSQAFEIAECWSTHHLEWFHFLKFIPSLIFGPIVPERSTPYRFLLFETRTTSIGESDRMKFKLYRYESPDDLFGSSFRSPAHSVHSPCEQILMCSDRYLDFVITVWYNWLATACCVRRDSNTYVNCFIFP